MLVFFMTGFYTRTLGTAGFGIVSNVVSLSSLLIAAVTLSIGEGVVRFAAEKSLYSKGEIKTDEYNKKGVFTNGLSVAIAGGTAFLLLSNLLFGILKVPVPLNLGAYYQLIGIYVLSGGIKSITALFVRSNSDIKFFKFTGVKLYALDGVNTTFLNIGFNILLLIVFKLGVKGYVLSVIFADICSICFLTITAKTYRYIDFTAGRDFFKSMLKYSLPFVPTALLFWVVNLSDGFMLKIFKSDAMNGVYQAAYKIPSLIGIVSGIFSQAFVISAVEENSSPQKERDRFYSSVFGAFYSAVFLSIFGLILIGKPLLSIMTPSNGGFETAYKVAPILLFSGAFTCFSQYVGNFYAVEKNTVNSAVTAAFGAGVNILLNFLLIPPLGMFGAAIATLLAYIVIFFVRLKDCSGFLNLKVNYLRFFLNCTVSVIMCIIPIIFKVGITYYGLLGAFFALGCLFNYSAVWDFVKNKLLN